MEFDAAVAELDTLVQTLEREGDERALLLLDLVDAIHRPALERIMAGDVEHPIAQAVLAMYDLAPLDPVVAVEEALDSVRPYIESHGGNVELLDVEGGVVHLRLSGACEGCAGSSMTLRRGIEAALRERFEGFERIEAHAPERPLLQIGDLRRPVFEQVAGGDVPEPGEMRATTVGDVALVLANVGGDVYAFRDACAVDGLPLAGGRLAETVIVCPWHNCAYDARSGRRVDGEDGPPLAAVPIADKGRGLAVAVNSR